MLKKDTVSVSNRKVLIHVSAHSFSMRVPADSVVLLPLGCFIPDNEQELTGARTRAVSND